MAWFCYNMLFNWRHSLIVSSRYFLLLFLPDFALKNALYWIPEQVVFLVKRVHSSGHGSHAPGHGFYPNSLLRFCRPKVVFDVK